MSCVPDLIYRQKTSSHTLSDERNKMCSRPLQRAFHVVVDVSFLSLSPCSVNNLGEAESVHDSTTPTLRYHAFPLVVVSYPGYFKRK